jgi:hypothetical protein
LGPKSTAALAELQSQLLTMAVEKAALLRQLQQGRSAVEKLQEKVGRPWLLGILLRLIVPGMLATPMRSGTAQL